MDKKKKGNQAMKKKIKESQVDKVISIWVRNRDGHCLKCGTKDNLQAAHIFSRTARSVRFDPLNILTLCWRCHLSWAHRNPIEFTEFVQKHLGKKNYAELKKRYYKLKSWTQAEYKSLIEKYKLST